MSQLIVKKIQPPGSLPLEIAGSRTLKVDSLRTWLGHDVDVRVLSDVISFYQAANEMHEYTFSGDLGTGWTVVGTPIEWSTGSYNVSIRVEDSVGNIAVFTGQTSFINKLDQVRVADTEIILYHIGDQGIQLQARLSTTDAMNPITFDVRNTSGAITVTSLDITVVRFA